MVKARQGRITNAAKSRKKDNPPRPQRIVDRAREKALKKGEKTNMLDTTTLADDDPTPTLRERVRGFITLMGDDTSEEEDDNKHKTDKHKGTDNEGDDTPRKGDDKKRQRFAHTTEIIEPGKEDDNDDTESENEIPIPTKLIERLESDSEMSTQPVTIVADILGEGPEQTVEFPQPLVITKDCRYSGQIKVPPCENPTQYTTEKFTEFLQWIQNKVGKDLSIATCIGDLVWEFFSDTQTAPV